MKINPKTIELGINDRVVVQRALEMLQKHYTKAAARCTDQMTVESHEMIAARAEDLLNSDFFSDLSKGDQS